MAHARTPIVGGNWKMNTNRESAKALAAQVVEQTADAARQGVEVVVFPPFVYLADVAERVNGTPVMAGAQNLYPEDDGAFTGEISTAMVKDCGGEWVLAGHSERRHVIGETDDLINRKVRKALADGLKVILCVGETREQRDRSETDDVNMRQIRQGLADVSSADMARIVIAYEPVWAIGTGLTATPEDAQNAHRVIRETVRSLFGDSVADQVRIQYGGSVKPGNAAELFSQSDIDGGLIGGASLKADDFAHIVRAALPG